MDQKLLTVTDLDVVLSGNRILKNISFSVSENDTLAIIGPNGAGKSILFKAMLGLVPYSGSVVWKPGTKIGYVPQRLVVGQDLPITTRDFFALKHVPEKEVFSLLQSVGFAKDAPHAGHLESHVLNERLGYLSGGELQRVLIAWALADHPNVLLFDEPTAGVDASTEDTIYALLRRLKEQHRLTILLISHELQVVYRYATQVLCLNKVEVCFGPPDRALDHKNLSALFGQDTGIYHHRHTHD